jgi:hypothetical protein
MGLVRTSHGVTRQWTLSNSSNIPKRNVQFSIFDIGIYRRSKCWHMVSNHPHHVGWYRCSRKTSEDMKTLASAYLWPAIWSLNSGLYFMASWLDLTSWKANVQQLSGWEIECRITHGCTGGVAYTTTIWLVCFKDLKRSHSGVTGTFAWYVQIQ